MSKKNKTSIALVAIVLIIFALCFFIVRPLLAQIKEESIKYQEKLSFFERRSELKNYLEKLESDIEEVLKKSPTFEAMLFDSDETITFVTELEEIAAQTSNWQELSVSVPSQEKQKFPFEEFGISLKGSFPNLIRYLVHLENMQWLVGVDSLGISKIKGVREELPADLPASSIETNLKIKVYTK